MLLTDLFLSLLLLLLLGQLVRARSIVDEDLEVVHLPMERSHDNAAVPLRFSAFGRKVDLLLRKNEHLVASNFEIWKRKRNGSTRINDHVKYSSWYYLHESAHGSAAISLREAGAVQGFVFFDNDILEITPLDEEESPALARSRSLGKPHAVKRRRISSSPRGARELDWTGVGSASRRRESRSHDDGEIEPATSGTSAETLTVELAVFFDETAYRRFAPHLSNDDAQLLDLLLAYVNNIQALYHHPSLGQRIDVALTRLELMEKQPNELAHLDGERSEALDSFCKYSESLNAERDDDPRHWDMGLYVSGLDFYALENGRKNRLTMGLAPVGGVCWSKYACAIAEFGVNDQLGRPFPSAGFTSVYVAAHEMAHNLGMHHDSSGNDCPRDGFIMSASRGDAGETQWSECSRELALSLASSKTCLLDRPATSDRLDHRARFAGLPGRRWSAKRQCELLLRDHEAFVDSLENCCTSLGCRTRNGSGFYSAGPALDGTECDENKECRAGECLPTDDQREAVAASPKSTGWTNWYEGRCKSACIRGSLGFVERRRECLLADRHECPGDDSDVILCKDKALCEDQPRKRFSVEEHVARRCLEFSVNLGIDAIDPTARGLQAKHELKREWLACTVFCKRKDIDLYYTPRLDLEEIGVDPYLPDGTWCHRDSGQDYFCRKHRCLPENFRFDAEAVGLLADDDDDDLDFNGQPIAPSSRLVAERDFKDVGRASDATAAAAATVARRRGRFGL